MIRVNTKFHFSFSNHLNFSLKKIGKQWSSQGLKTRAGSTSIECLSDHLTAFSVLLDPTPLDKISDLHQNILTWISYFGSGLSILGLSVTVLLYSLFRNLRRDRGGKILLNLSISLLLLHIVFVVGSSLGSMKYNENSPGKSSSPVEDDRVWVLGSDEFRQDIHPHSDLCAGVAILTHYLVLSSLSWMLVEAVHMYQLLITVFANSETFFMGKRMLAAWGKSFGVKIIFYCENNYFQFDRNSTCCCLDNVLVKYGFLQRPAEWGYLPLNSSTSGGLLRNFYRTGLFHSADQHCRILHGAQSHIIARATWKSRR